MQFCVLLYWISILYIVLPEWEAVQSLKAVELHCGWGSSLNLSGSLLMQNTYAWRLALSARAAAAGGGCLYN